MTIAALRRASLFTELPESLLERLVDGGDVVELVDGATLMEEGSPADAMFVVLDGVLEIRKRVDDREIVLAHVEAGELIGELALVHRRPRSAGVRAVGAVRLLRIPGEALDDLLAHPSASRALLAAATGRLERQELLLRQHGRMAALGSLTAGLLHELNNPAAAVRRGAEQLATALTTMDHAETILASSAPALRSHLSTLADQLAAQDPSPPAGPLARAEAEGPLRATLQRHGVDHPGRLTGALVDAAISPEEVDGLLDGADAISAQAAMSWLAARATTSRLLHELDTGAERISEIVGAVKKYAHTDEAPVQDVDVHDGLEAALTLLRHKIPDGVQITRRYADHLPTVPGFPGDLNGVWTNLLDNALDAVGDHGEVQVITAATPEHVTVRVVDDGAGIPAEVLDRVFDPFFTTKPVGAGTGLGMAIAHAVVSQRHRGSIDLDSRPGHTEVTVTLPRTVSATPPTSAPRPREEPIHG